LTVMVESSVANAQTKKRNRDWDKTRKEKGKKRKPTARRVREGSDRRYRDKQREPMLRALTEAASAVGKVTASGRRMCMWDGCTTVISRYNYEECCSNHQRDWSRRNKLISCG